MRPGNSRDNRNIGTAKLCHFTNLPNVVSTHFNNSRAVLLRQLSCKTVCNLLGIPAAGRFQDVKRAAAIFSGKRARITELFDILLRYSTAAERTIHIFVNARYVFQAFIAQYCILIIHT